MIIFMIIIIITIGLLVDKQIDNFVNMKDTSKANVVEVVGLPVGANPPVRVERTGGKDNELTTDIGQNCYIKPPLLFDGIWERTIDKRGDMEIAEWSITNGHNKYYCDDRKDNYPPIRVPIYRERYFPNWCDTHIVCDLDDLNGFIDAI